MLAAFKCAFRAAGGRTRKAKKRKGYNMDEDAVMGVTSKDEDAVMGVTSKDDDAAMGVTSKDKEAIASAILQRLQVERDTLIDHENRALQASKH